MVRHCSHRFHQHKKVVEELIKEVVTKDYKIDSKAIEGVIGGNNATIDYSKLIELMDKLNTKYLYSATWLMSRNVASHIRNLKDQASGKFIWQNAILSNMPDTLLSCGKNESEK